MRIKTRQVQVRVYTCTALINTYLNDCALSGDFENLALAALSVSEYDVDDLCVPD
jgi:hypothetical protein